MKKLLPKNPRILSIAPSTTGFGFVVIEGHQTLADWGVKTIPRNKNNGSIAKVKELISRYQPDVLVLEDVSTRIIRSPRIQTLHERIIELADKKKLTVLCFKREQVLKTYIPEGKRTKYGVAQKMAERFPDELGFRLPPKRVFYKSEDAQMYMFHAVALALMVR